VLHPHSSSLLQTQEKTSNFRQLAAAEKEATPSVSMKTYKQNDETDARVVTMVVAEDREDRG
jgi:hypothetical protein